MECYSYHSVLSEDVFLPDCYVSLNYITYLCLLVEDWMGEWGNKGG